MSEKILKIILILFSISALINAINIASLNKSVKSSESNNSNITITNYITVTNRTVGTELIEGMFYEVWDNAGSYSTCIEEQTYIRKYTGNHDGTPGALFNRWDNWRALKVQPEFNDEE